ncbi:hypothetical protein HERIO_295 [Hepatospora eriocheir]|uniref:Uncharacterized protein n=1 Tax=Hepatospora eriocheir TaxID=1081669 RepID=A0A1X0QDF7_9MICR|nr:hypothetical protein HERIO_295 [Hepatospora eriocheir]
MENLNYIKRYYERLKKNSLNNNCIIEELSNYLTKIIIVFKSNYIKDYTARDFKNLKQEMSCFFRLLEVSPLKKIPRNCNVYTYYEFGVYKISKLIQQNIGNYDDYKKCECDKFINRIAFLYSFNRMVFYCYKKQDFNLLNYLLRI